jgi:hypothetical protein
MRSLARYRKAGVALLGALAVAGAELPADAPSWLTGVCALAAALGVYLVPNAPPPRFPPPAPTRYQRGWLPGGHGSGDTPASQLRPPTTGTRLPPDG